MIEKTGYKGWPNTYRISNGEVELFLTSDVGPRIMRYAFVNGPNLFKEFSETLGKSGEEKWQLRGGHRLWVAPEDPIRTYQPDNGPVDIEVFGDGVRATQPVERITGLEKQVTVRMARRGTGVTVTHVVRNAGFSTTELAVWTPTMLAQGGAAVHAFPPRATHQEALLPTHPLVMWAFTDLSDPRWKFTRKHLILRQDPDATSPTKLGTFNPWTWGAYILGSDVFIKRSRADPSKRYADFGSSFEAYAEAAFLELETLGPLVRLAPGERVEHVESWTLHRNVKISRWIDEELDRVLLPLVGSEMAGSQSDLPPGRDGPCVTN